MAQLNFDAATVEPQQSFEPVPEGWYTVMAVASEMKPTKDGGNAYLEMTLKIVEPQAFANRQLFYRLNIKNSNPVAQEIAYKQLSAICHAVGIIQVADSQQLHGLPFKVRVTIKKDVSGKYDPSNEIKAIKGVNEGAAAPAFVPQATPPAAPAFAQQSPAPTPQAAGAVPPWMQPKA